MPAAILDRHDLVRMKGAADAICARCKAPVWFDDATEMCEVHANGSVVCGKCRDAAGPFAAYLKRPRRYTRRAIALALACASLASAGDKKPAPHKWLKRLSAVAVCAASGADMLTTRLGQLHGLTEQNALLAGRNGQPNWGATAGVNIGMCGGAIVAAAKLPAAITVPLNAAMALPKSYAVAHNVSQLEGK
jgi:hypothetical protein